MNVSDRPQSLQAVALSSETEAEFGHNLADFEHELVRLSSRKALAATIAAPPPRLAGVFDSGATADAWLASYAEELAFRFDLAYPDWIWAPERFLEKPYLHDAHSARLKVWHTLKSPASFSRRNLFVDIHLPPVRLRRGRPGKTAEHKRAMNRQRVARHRAQRRETQSD